MSTTPPVFPSADGSIELSPHDATLEGPPLRVERAGVIGGVNHNLGYRLDPIVAASWPIGIGSDQGGEFEVSIEVACRDESGGAGLELEFEPGGTLAFAVSSTGGWQEYRTLELGQVRLPFGSHRAIMRAKSKAGEGGLQCAGDPADAGELTAAADSCSADFDCAFRRRRRGVAWPGPLRGPAGT